jgi:hypothetical protein
VSYTKPFYIAREAEGIVRPENVASFVEDLFASRKEACCHFFTDELEIFLQTENGG